MSNSVLALLHNITRNPLVDPQLRTRAGFLLWAINGGVFFSVAL